MQLGFLTQRFSFTASSARILIAVFYSVGIVGMLFPATRNLFIKLTPLALLLSAYVLYVFHDTQNRRTANLVFLLIFVTAFLVEAVGVSTGAIFGQYQYGHGLGFKLFDTPLLIGLNWILLVYLSQSVARNFSQNPVVVVPLASVIMVLYDIILEQVAPKMDMWHWQNQQIPLQNYMAWFALALIFNFILVRFRVSTQNLLAPTVLLAQFVFFLTLLIWL